MLVHQTETNKRIKTIVWWNRRRVLDPRQNDPSEINRYMCLYNGEMIIVVVCFLDCFETLVNKENEKTEVMSFYCRTWLWLLFLFFIGYELSRYYGVMYKVYYNNNNKIIIIVN